MEECVECEGYRVCLNFEWRRRWRNGSAALFPFSTVVRTKGINMAFGFRENWDRKLVLRWVTCWALKIGLSLTVC